MFGGFQGKKLSRASTKSFSLWNPRACLKKAFRELQVSVCGRFYPNEGGVAGYDNRMRVKYTAKWGLQIAEMIFQTRSSIVVPFGKCNVESCILFLLLRNFQKTTSDT